MTTIFRIQSFETNSSSAHTITVSKKTQFDSQLTVNTDDDGLRFIVVKLGKFGWGYDKFVDAANKLSYIFTSFVEKGVIDVKRSWTTPQEGIRIDLSTIDMTNPKMEWVLSVFNAISEVSLVDYILLSHDGYPYVDHQSVHVIDSVLKGGVEHIKNFVYNSKSKLTITNDNG